MSVQDRLRDVRGRIEAACSEAGRDRAEVRLIAVSKRQPLDRLLEAYEEGQRDFGENFVQELERKKPLLPNDARWHLIGHLQSNKAKRAAVADWVHTVDSAKLLRALSSSVPDQQALRCLIQVNLAKEPGKSGLAPEALPSLCLAAKDVPHVVVEGLMCIPPPHEGAAYFPKLRSIRDQLESELAISLPQLSMGMSDDYSSAISHGATMIRVGTAIFGPRET